MRNFIIIEGNVTFSVLKLYIVAMFFLHAEDRWMNVKSKPSENEQSPPSFNKAKTSMA